MAKALNVVINGKEFVSPEAKKAGTSLKELGKETTTQSKIMAAGAVAAKAAFASMAVGIVAVTALVKKAITEAADMETMTTSFEVLIGNTEKAKKVISDLRAFAAATPLQFVDIAKGAQTLMAFGSAAEDVQAQLSMIGDIAQGQTAKLESVVRAYGKIQARGKASLEEINMVTEAGVPILAELARMYGTSTDALLKMITAGKIGFADVDQAFKNMTSSGGQFYGMLNKQSQTFNGMVSTLKDNLSLMMQKLGESILPTATLMLKDALGNLNEFIASPAFDEFAKKIGMLAVNTYSIIGGLGEVIKGMYADIKTYITSLFSPDIMDSVIGYLEYGINNTMKLFNLPLDLFNSIYSAVGITPGKKLPTDISLKNEPEPISQYDQAIENLKAIMAANLKAYEDAWNKTHTPSGAPVSDPTTPPAPPAPTTDPYSGPFGISLLTGLDNLGQMIITGIPNSMLKFGFVPPEKKEPSMFQAAWDGMKSTFKDSGLFSLFADLSGSISGFMSGLVGSISSLSSIQSLLDPLYTILSGVMEILGPVIDEVLGPLVGILKIVGNVIGSLLVPVIRLLTPIIEFIGEAFVWLYNNAIVPVANGFIWVINIIRIGFAKVINGLIDAINWIPGVNLGHVSVASTTDGMLSAIDYASLEQAGSSDSSSYSGGSTGSSTSIQSVTINIYQTFDGNVIGDGGLESVGAYVVSAINAYTGIGGATRVIGGVA
jgi:tape measure domain-containing protein